MTGMSRRQFFRKAGTHAAVAGILAADVMTMDANPLGLPIGSQTYPHRAMIQSGHFAELAATLTQIGVQAVEMCSPFDYEEFAPLKDGKAAKKVLADSRTGLLQWPLRHARTADSAGREHRLGARRRHHAHDDSDARRRQEPHARWMT